MNINISLSTSSIETVTKNIITKLYDLAFNAGENDTIEYQGNLYSATAYNKEVEWLQLNFHNLIINVPSTGLYIKFEDPEIERVLLANNIGDGIGVTLTVAASATLGSIFSGNKTITKFPEFKYFTKENINPTSYSMFSGCSNLVEIDSSNATNYKVAQFSGCSSLRLTIDDIYNVQTFYGYRDEGPFGKSSNNQIVDVQNLNLPNCTSIGDNGFYGMISIKTINLPNLTALNGNGTFAYCTNLEEVTSLGNITTIGGDFNYHQIGMFLGCTKLRKVVLPPNLIRIPYYMFGDCSSLSDINIPATITRVDNGAFGSGLVSLHKPLYFPNVAGDLPRFIGGPTYDIYFPKTTRTVPAFGSWNGNPESTHFTYRGDSTTKKLIYLKDFTSFGVYTFLNTTINTLIINNVTPPTIELTTNTNTANLTNYPSASTDIFYGSTISNIYVPDSAVDTYKNNSLYSSQVSKIKPLSECPRITVAQAEAGEVGLIEEYMS